MSDVKWLVGLLILFFLAAIWLSDQPSSGGAVCTNYSVPGACE